MDESTAKILNKRNEIIVTDYDDVLQNVAIQWLFYLSLYYKSMLLKTCIMQKLDFKKIMLTDFNINPDKSESKKWIDNLFHRNEYYLDSYLLENKNNPLNEEERKELYRCYTAPENFYSNIEFNPIAYSLKYSLGQRFTTKLVVLSHSLRGNDERKEKQLIKFFGKDLYNNKIEYIPIDPSISKYEWIKNNCENFTLFIDDRWDILREVIKDTRLSKQKTFLMPMFGYNRKYREDGEILDLMRVNDIQFTDYSSIANFNINNKIYKYQYTEE